MQELLRNQQDILRKGMKDQEEIRDQEEIIVKEILMSQEKLDNTDNV
jgi:hypothetical protein